MTEQLFCTCCRRELRPDRIKWLELNHRTCRWTDPEKVQVPENESQGGFPFGLACARRQLASGKECVA